MEDHRWIFEIAKISAAQLHPQLKPDVGKILELVKEAIGSPKHYCRLVRGEQWFTTDVLIAFTAPCLWAQRTASHIVLWRGTGAGATLLRDYRRWVLEQPNLRVAGLAVDCEIDTRTGALLERVGFHRRGGAYLMYPKEVRNGLFEQSRQGR